MHHQNKIHGVDGHLKNITKVRLLLQRYKLKETHRRSQRKHGSYGILDVCLAPTDSSQLQVGWLPLQLHRLLSLTFSQYPL